MTTKIAPQKLFNMAVLDLLNEATVKTIELQEENEELKAELKKKIVRRKQIKTHEEFRIENEKLKKEIEYRTQESSDLYDIIKQMKKENEELKIALDRFIDLVDYPTLLESKEEREQVSVGVSADW